MFKIMNTLKKLMTPKNMAILLLISFATFFPVLFKMFVIVLVIIILIGVVFTTVLIMANCVETNSWKPLKDILSKFINK